MSSQFGFNEFNQLVHVKEVERGLACQCRCVVCDEPLIARQGEVRNHHFAHASNREPCESSHESLLHRYAKQAIIDAMGLVVPVTPAIAHFLGCNVGESDRRLLQAILPASAEVAVGSIRPDLLLVTTDGVQVAVEIAYSSFCDTLKAAEFERINLPALEIDLSAFTPDAFDPVLVREVVVAAVHKKSWVWPVTSPDALVDTEPATPLPALKQFLPEEIITFSGRWVSIRQFPSGDIAVKVVKYDPDLVSLVKSICKQHGGRYNAKYRSWNVQRWAARTVRQTLENRAKTMEITMGFVAEKGV
jgi:competence protein CoiA